MINIQEISPKDAYAQAHATYFLTEKDSEVLAMYIPISQAYGKNMRWIFYSSGGIISPIYLTQRELTEQLRKYKPEGNRIFQAYLMQDEYLNFCRFNINDRSKSELNSILKENTTLNAHRTVTPKKTIVRKTVARKPAVRKPATRRPARK